MPKYDFDYFVIGAGSGGVRSARIAGAHGAKVAIAEYGPLGGTCVNVGCVPKKLLAYASDFGPGFEDARGFGWSAGKPRFDWPTLIKNKNKEIKRLNGIYKTLLDGAGVTLINGVARFVDDHTLEVKGKTYTADKILIATGGAPKAHTAPGNEFMVTSNDMFFLEKLPKKAVIVGGGYIAVEFAHILHGLGVDVTLMYRGSLFLRGFDDDIRLTLCNEMRKQGIKIHFHCDLASVTKKGKTLTVHSTAGHTASCDLVLSAIGRLPNTENLNLEAAGVDCLSCGTIPVNERYQTCVPHIYAIGDVTDRHNLTPIAIREGHTLADNLFGDGRKKTVDYTYVPSAVFSHPPIGTVGMSEEQARKKRLGIDIYKSRFRPMKHTLSGRDELTMMKLIVHKKTNKVIGVHMVGLDAPEIIQGFAAALSAGATKADFDRTIAIHPTAAEEFVTMREVVKGG